MVGHEASLVSKSGRSAIDRPLLYASNRDPTTTPAFRILSLAIPGFPSSITAQRRHQLGPLPPVEAAVGLRHRFARDHPAHRRQHLRRQHYRAQPVVEERLISYWCPSFHGP